MAPPNPAERRNQLPLSIANRRYGKVAFSMYTGGVPQLAGFSCVPTRNVSKRSPGSSSSQNFFVSKQQRIHAILRQHEATAPATETRSATNGLADRKELALIPLILCAQFAYATGPSHPFSSTRKPSFVSVNSGIDMLLRGVASLRPLW